MFGLDNLYLSTGFALGMIGALSLLSSVLLTIPEIDNTLVARFGTLLLVAGAVVYLAGCVVRERVRRERS